MLPVSYFALLADQHRPRDRPAGLVRRIHTQPIPTDEALHRDLRWHPTEYLQRYYIAGTYEDHVEITEEEEEAQAAIPHWREHGVTWRPGD
jgi:hypothetical protein